MNSDEPLHEAALEYLSGAVRALNRGAPLSAVREMLIATNMCYSLFKRATRLDKESYEKGWLETARELSKLDPSLVREAVRIIDEGSPPGE